MSMITIWKTGPLFHVSGEMNCIFCAYFKIKSPPPWLTSFAAKRHQTDTPPYQKTVNCRIHVESSYSPLRLFSAACPGCPHVWCLCNCGDDVRLCDGDQCMSGVWGLIPGVLDHMTPGLVLCNLLAVCTDLSPGCLSTPTPAHRPLSVSANLYHHRHVPPHTCTLSQSIILTNHLDF